MNNKTSSYQQKVLKILSGKINNFYLAGGTALSVFYFQHRDSEDLDFFTQKLDKMEVIEIVKKLSEQLKKPIKLINQQFRKNMVKMMIYSIEFNKKNSLKIDFVEDYIKLLKQPKNVDGINVMSIEDIYLRKIHTVVGFWNILDITGRPKIIGNRQESKDILDLYYLSHTFTGLADFVYKYCDKSIIENIIRWYRTYNRLEIKLGLQELKLKRQVEFQEIEKHFKKEIDKLLEKEVDFI